MNGKFNGMLCPICAQVTDEAFTVNFRNTKPPIHEDPLDFPVTYNRCIKCGCHFSADQRNWYSADFKDKCYNSTYHIYDGDINNPTGNRPTYHYDMLKLMLNSKSECVLDWGCGRGFVVDRLSKEGYSIVGYDPFYGNTESTPQPNSFDVITSFEVLEHAYHCVDLFKQFHTLLKPNGFIYASTDLTDYMQDVKINYYTCPRVGHVVLHSKQSLLYIANTCGFQLINIPRDAKSGIQGHIFIKR